MAKNPLLAGLPPVHPGAILREDVLPALGRSKKEIAEILKVSRQTLHDILAERQPITAPMAAKLGKLCGNGGGVWLRMQQVYDLERAERELEPVLAEIPTLKAVSA